MARVRGGRTGSYVSPSTWGGGYRGPAANMPLSGTYSVPGSSLSGANAFIVSFLKATNPTLAGKTDDEIMELYGQYMGTEGAMGWSGMQRPGGGGGQFAKISSQVAKQNNVPLVSFADWYAQQQGTVGNQQIGGVPGYYGGGLVTQRY